MSVCPSPVVRRTPQIDVAITWCAPDNGQDGLSVFVIFAGKNGRTCELYARRVSKPGRQARVKNNKPFHLRRGSPRSSRMFLRRPARTRRPPRSRIGLIIAKAVSTRRLRRHRTAGRLSVLATPKACAATTRAHLIHVRCQYAAQFTDAFYIYISRGRCARLDSPDRSHEFRLVAEPSVALWHGDNCTFASKSHLF